MRRDRMTGSIGTERLVLFPYTAENLHLFNTDRAGFEAQFGVVYDGEETDSLLAGFLRELEGELAADPENSFFLTEFLMVLKENSRIIGTVEYKQAPAGGVTEVGYGMNPAYTGRGYMTEALTALLEAGRARGLRAVRADTAPENLRSQHVLERCGFRFLRRDGDRLWWEISLE